MSCCLLNTAALNPMEVTGGDEKDGVTAVLDGIGPEREVEVEAEE